MTGQEYSIIGILVVGILALWKVQQGYYAKVEKERKEANAQLLDNCKTQSDDLKEEVKAMRLERKEERKEWLDALDNNTEQLKNVADKLCVIPTLQQDVDGIKDDVEDIKNKLNGGAIKKKVNEND